MKLPKKVLPSNVSFTHKDLFNKLVDMNPGHIYYCEYPVIKLYNRFCKLYGDDLILKARIKNLRIDIYDRTLNIAFEIMGMQHYSYVEFFHKKESNFYRYVNNDSVKKKFCNQYNVKYIEVDVNNKINNEFLRDIYYEK